MIKNSLLKEPITVTSYPEDNKNLYLNKLDESPMTYDLILSLGDFEGLPVYSLTGLTLFDCPFEPEKYITFIKDWVSGLLESYQGLTNPYIKAYVSQILKATPLSSTDEDIDRLIVRYHIDKYC